MRESAHEIKVHAPAETVYELIADVTNWPRLFPPTVHVEHLDRPAAGEERIQIWATANGTAKTWRSRRVLDPAALRIEFRQEVSAPPVARMGGAWLIDPISTDECVVRLLHDYRAVGDDPAKLKWIDEAVDRNSHAELAALKRNAELSASEEFSFEDIVPIRGSVRDVYDFINDAALWTDRLPHVARASVVEDTPGLQLLAMDTRTADGSVHTTESVRVCLPHQKIVYKQTKLPGLLSLHTGHWLFEETSDGMTATSRHTVVINPTNIATILGDEATAEDAKRFVHKALSTNSRATLGHAKNYAEKIA